MSDLNVEDPSALKNGHPPTTLLEYLEIFRVFRSYAQHEDNLVNNRMMWMLSIHGFLYAAYALTLQKNLEILEKISLVMAKCMPDVDLGQYYLANTNLDGALTTLTLFLYFVAIVGILISASALWSINAAFNAIDGIRSVFAKQFPTEPYEGGALAFSIPWETKDRLFLPALVGGGRMAGDKAGRIVSIAIPLVLIGSWIAAMAGTAYYTRKPMQPPKIAGSCVKNTDQLLPSSLSM